MTFYSVDIRHNQRNDNDSKRFRVFAPDAKTAVCRALETVEYDVTDRTQYMVIQIMFDRTMEGPR